MLILEPSNREQFIDASERLLLALDPATALEIAGGVPAVREAIVAGQEAPPTPMNVLVVAFLAIVGNHVFRGLPLALPDAIIEACLAGGPECVPFNECGACGLVTPRNMPVCPLCAGQTGFGAYGQRQTRKAACN